MNHLPAPLAAFIDQFNDLVAQYNAGGITPDEATAVLTALSTTDGAGAVWGISINGQLTRAEYPGAPPVPADPSQWVDVHTARPAAPAFPMPGAFDSFGDLDSPPQAGYGADPSWGPGPSPVMAAAPAPSLPAKSLAEPRGGDGGQSLVGKVLAIVMANKVFAGIVVVGLLVIAAALVLPKMSADDGTQVPTGTPTPTVTETTAPPASAATPTSDDAGTVYTALASADPAQVQAMIQAPLDPVALLRTQALWAGLGASDVVVKADPAATDAAGAITQTWHLFLGDATTQTAQVVVTWVAVDAAGQPVPAGTTGATWKLAAAPTF